MRGVCTWGSELEGEPGVQEGGLGWEPWCTPVIPAFGKLRQQDWDGLDY